MLHLMELRIFSQSGAPAFVDVDATQQEHAAYEKDDQGQDAQATPAGKLAYDGKNKGTDDIAELPTDGVKAEELGRLPFGHEGGKKRTTQGLTAPLDHGDRAGECPELPRFGHKIAENRYACINHEGEIDSALGADPRRQGSVGKSTRYAQELYEEKGSDEMVRPDSYFRSVDSGHLDDGVDSVVVEPKSD
jgi:hypothetical protein